MKLLSVESDSKTVKGSQHGYLTGILYLAPARSADGIHNLCPMATPECETACLNTAGRASIFPAIQAARVRKTLAYLNDPVAFKATLCRDIEALCRMASRRGMIPAVRINGTSDLPALALDLVDRFPGVQFYDYTKIPRPWERRRANYHLTFSFSGSNLVDALDALAHGVNVAVVFNGGLPDTWHGYQVVDGDSSDLRFLDASGVVVGLKAKGRARTAPVGGFVQAGAKYLEPTKTAAHLIQIGATI